ncbi:MAG TPA: hypothetical protein VMS73_08655 [Anaerolineaceae bacterium]|nr:hypothetical protein [Anaerolineaceae bacterium]
MKRNLSLWGTIAFLVLSLLVTGCSAATPSSLPGLTQVHPVLPTQPVDSSASTVLVPNGGMPARENYSLVSGKVLAVSPDPQKPAMLRAQISVTASDYVQNYPSRTDDKVGQEINVLVPQDLARDLKVGDSIQLQVSYRGDESGGAFFGSQLVIVR